MKTGDQSYGLFQINMLGNLGPSRRKQYGLSSNDDLYDPLTNAKVAFRLSKGGTDFGAWGVGPNAYRQTAPLNFAGYPGETQAQTQQRVTTTKQAPRQTQQTQPKVNLAQLNALARQHGFKNFRQAFGFDDDGQVMRLLAQSGAKVPTVRTLQGNVPVVNNSDGRLPKSVAKVVDLADDYLGVKYTWGGKTPQTGFDCSGFVQYLFKQVGVELPGYTIPLYATGEKVQKQADLRPGDAVFFNWGTHPETNEQGPQHMGLYIGNGLFIQAPRTGDVVKISRMSDRSDFLGGRRYL